MKKVPMWRRYLTFWGADIKADLEREFEFHLDMRTREFIEAGWEPAAARREAQRRFGDLSAFRRECRVLDHRQETAARRTEHWNQMRNDIVYAFRQLRRTPAFTVVTILTLAIAIGANATIFSLLHGVVIQPLPYVEPDRLMSLWEVVPEQSRVSAANFIDWREKNDVFAEMAIFAQGTLNLTGEGQPEELHGVRVSAAYFPLLGIQPILGRWITPDEDAPGGPAVVLIDEDLWRTRFGADPKIIGRSIRLSGRPYSVIGVMPSGLYPSWPATPGSIQFQSEHHRYWTPIALSPQYRSNRHSHVFGVIARLKKGVSREIAQSSMDSIGRALAEAYPRTNKNEGVVVKPLTGELVGEVQTGLIILQVSVAFVLLIASANVTSLAIARLSARRREIAVRTALGASRARLIRQFLVEGALLAAIGGAVGLVVARLALRILPLLAPSDFPRIGEVHLSAATIAFTLTACGLTCLLFALIPALQASRSNPQEAIQDAGRSVTAGSPRQRLRQWLVAGQVAVAVMLLIGSVLLIESFRNLRNVNPGFDPDGLLAIGLTLPSTSYPRPTAIVGFAEELLDEAKALPEVRAAAVSYDHPLEANWIDIFSITNRPTEPGRDSPSGYFRIVSPGYFETAGIGLVRGRLFDAFDNNTAHGTVIISEAFAAQFFPGEEPLGQSLDLRTPQAIWGPVVPGRFEIVGIVRDTRFMGVDKAAPPAFYVPFGQCPSNAFTIMVKGQHDPDSLVPSIRAVVWAIDPNQPIASSRSMHTILDHELARPRFNTFLMTLFGIVALVLSSVGIYGLLAYLVSQRISEIGIRVALGAGKARIFTMVVAQGLKLASAGMLCGLVGAVVVTRLLERLLFGVSPRDPAAFALATAFLGVVAVIACAVPALQATRVNPAVTLKRD